MNFFKFIVEAFLTIAIKAALKMLSNEKCEDILDCILNDKLNKDRTKAEKE